MKICLRQNIPQEDIIRIVQEEDVRFIRLQFTDIFGSFKNIAITASQLEKALNNKCMFDGSSIEGFVRIEESDMYLYPDLDTFTIFPWYDEDCKAARLICDVYKPDGTPFEGDPRGLLKKVLAQAQEMGFTDFNVGPECEFFLFNYDEDGHPTTKTFDRGAYFELGPTDLGESARRDMCLVLEDMGFEIEASHHEVASGQQKSILNTIMLSMQRTTSSPLSWLSKRWRTSMICMPLLCPNQYTVWPAVACMSICL